MTSDQNKDVQNLDDIREVVENIGSTRADLIPVLQAITNKFGYISQSAIKELSGLMGLPTKRFFCRHFYRMLSTQPRGKHVIQFCESAPCHVVGGREVF